MTLHDVAWHCMTTVVSFENSWDSKEIFAFLFSTQSLLAALKCFTLAMASASPPEAAHIEAASTSAEIAAAEEHIDKILDKIVYRVSFVDGSEIHVELPPFATVNDLYKTVSNIRAVPSYRLQLIPSGQPAPVKRSPLKLVDVNSEEFMAVTSRHLELGEVLHGLTVWQPLNLHISALISIPDLWSICLIELLIPWCGVILDEMDVWSTRV